MNNVELAKCMLFQAGRRLETAKRELEGGSITYSIRSSQECAELSLKAALRLLGIEYPKKHDVSRLLLKFREKFPKWFQVELYAEYSAKLAEKREPAMYGDELRGLPPESMFSREDAEKAFEMAREIHESVKKLIVEYAGEDESR